METAPAVAVPGIKLGSKPPLFDHRTARLATFMSARRKWPKLPKQHDRIKKTKQFFPRLGMMGNDKHSNCTYATAGHLFQTWSVYGGKPWCPTDEQIIAAYLQHTGGQDEGAYILEVLRDLRNVGLAGNKIRGFAAVDVADIEEMKLATYLFGGVYCGVALPVCAQAELNTGKWETITGPGSEAGSWGYHALSKHRFTEKGPTFITWGQEQEATWDWWLRYGTEAYALVEEDFAGDDKRTTQGFSLAALDEYLKQL